jgi:hypothetical protein
MTTARKTLTADFQAKKKQGLRDLKFYAGNVTDKTVEAVCADVNDVFEKVRDGNFVVRKSWGDSHAANNRKER